MSMPWGKETQSILDWLRMHPNENHHSSRMQKELGLSAGKIASAADCFKRFPEFERPSVGYYRWSSHGATSPGTLPVGSLVEVIGQDATGTPLGRDEHNVIRKLVAL